MPQYEVMPGKSKVQIKKLNANREGSLLDFIEDFTSRFPKYVDDYETLLTDNRIWKQRLVGIGVVSPERALALGFRQLGVHMIERADGFEIEGGQRPTGGQVDAHFDHRLVMAFAVLALSSSGPTHITGADAVAVSYPDFLADLLQLCQ